jgi:plasmid stability protein
MARTLTIRNVPDDVVRELRGRARRNGRSMQSEILLVIRQATLDRGSLEKQLAALRGTVQRRIRIDEIHAAVMEGRP